MKKFIFLLSLLFIVSESKAQNCGFWVFSPNAEVEMTHYDKGGDESMRVISKVLSVNGSESKVSNRTVNKKGKEMSVSEGIYRCNNGVFSFDLQTMMPQQQNDAFKNMEVKTEPVYLEFPSNMSVGTTLKDANMSMEAYSGGMKLMTITFAVFNRKVEGQESITTPSGTYNCFKITNDFKMKSMFNFEGRTITWFAPGIGQIKTETYKGDKLMGSSLVTKITK